MMFRVGVLADSMETSVSWDKCKSCIDQIGKLFYSELDRLKIKGRILFR